MNILLRKALKYWYLLMVGLIFICTYPFVYYFSRKAIRYPKLNFFRKVCAFFPSAMSGIYYKFNYEQEIDWNKQYIVCPNHASNLDIFTMSLLMKNNFFFLGKEDLLKNPVTRLFFQTIDIPINRDSKMSSYRAFKKTSERIELGMSPVIFPEGKIGEEFPPLLHAFKSGPFRLAIAHQISILPVTIKDNWKVCWDNGDKFGLKPGISEIYIHKPVEVTGYTLSDDDALRQLVFDKIKSKLDYN